MITEAGEGVAATSPLPFQYLQTENLVRLILLLSVHMTIEDAQPSTKRVLQPIIQKKCLNIPLEGRLLDRVGMNEIN